MGEIKKKSVGSLQKGHYVIVDGVASIVHSTQTSRPGKHGHAKVRMQAVGMLDGKKREIVMPGHDQIDVPVIGKRNAQVLSVHGTHANIMDMESYETFDIDIPEGFPSLEEGMTVLYWDILDDKVLKQITNKEI